jgi:nucleoside-diphosphate-sugar epimerase
VDGDTPYAQSKREAEKWLNGRAVVLEPAMIHGPGNKGNLNLLFAVVKHGLPWPLAAFENKRSFTSIGNACAVVEELCKGKVPNGIYPLCDDESVSTNRLIELIAEATGKKARLWRLPKCLMRLGAKVGDVLHLPLNTERLGKLTETAVVDNSKLKTALGWRDMPVRAEEGLRETLRSF